MRRKQDKPLRVGHGSAGMDDGGAVWMCSCLKESSLRERPGTSGEEGTLPRGDRTVLRPQLNWEGGAAWNDQNWYHEVVPVWMCSCLNESRLRERPGTSGEEGTLPRRDRPVLRPQLNWEGRAAWNNQNWYHAMVETGARRWWEPPHHTCLEDGDPLMRAEYAPGFKLGTTPRAGRKRH